MEAALSIEQVESNLLDSFRARSGRFLFARPRAGGDLVYLEQGTAHERRAAARTMLRCPEPGCLSSEITTVSRAPSGARDGYRHLVRPDGEHSPESAFHRQAKALVVRWARGLPSIVQAEEEVRLGDGERVADVLLTSRSGNRLAVEIQYSALSVEQWLRRTRSYLGLGVAVTWLWGHLGAHSPLQDRWRETGAWLVQHPHPVLWINPAEELVAWAYDLHALDDPPTAPHPPRYEFGSLQHLDLRRSGLFPPGFLETSRLWEEQAVETRRQRDEAERERANKVAAARRRRLLRAPQSSLVAIEPRPVQAQPTRRTCRRCGLPLDPALKSGYHADPHCGEW